jgi:exonuclease VII small subunit
MPNTQTPTELTFEAGYERLKIIAERIDQEEVPVSELCDLFAEGKGLEVALTKYLDTQKTRLETIERGEGVQAFRIVAAGATDEERDGSLEMPELAFQTGAGGTGALEDEVPL